MLWLNTAMKTLWPYYNNAIGKMVLEQVGPALDPILAKARPLAEAQPRTKSCQGRGPRKCASLSPSILLLPGLAPQ